jgi:hypothetical protein
MGKLVEAQSQGVIQQVLELIGVEEGLEMLEPNPWASPDAKRAPKVLKGYLYSVKRRVVEYDEVHRHWQKEQV